MNRSECQSHRQRHDRVDRPRRRYCCAVCRDSAAFLPGVKSRTLRVCGWYPRHCCQCPAPVASGHGTCSAQYCCFLPDLAEFRGSHCMVCSFQRVQQKPFRKHQPRTLSMDPGKRIPGCRAPLSPHPVRQQEYIRRFCCRQPREGLALFKLRKSNGQLLCLSGGNGNLG